MFSWSHRKDPSRSGRGEMEQRRRQQGKGRGPRLERRNAVKNIDYEASGSGSGSGSASAFAGVSWSSSSSDESPGIGTSKSLDLSPSPYSNQTSFRLGGSIEGEVDLLYRSLGLTGPEDFAIPITVWEARKARSPTPRYPSFVPNSVPADPLDTSAEASVGRRDDEVEVPSQPGGPVAEIKVIEDESPKNSTVSPVVKGGDGGIKGVRPPVLAPPSAISTLSPPPVRSALALPPSMSIPAVDKGGSTWVAPHKESSDFGAEGGRRSSFNLEEDGEEEGAPTGEEVALEELRLGETFDDFTGTSSFATTNDDDTSSTTTETMLVISPNGRFKRTIRSWIRGELLGRGSFGTVYEGISE